MNQVLTRKRGVVIEDIKFLIKKNRFYPGLPGDQNEEGDQKKRSPILSKCFPRQRTGKANEENDKGESKNQKSQRGKEGGLTLGSCR